MSEPTYDRTAFEIARARMDSDPKLLTQIDLENLRAVDPELADRAADLRWKALTTKPTQPTPTRSARTRTADRSAVIADAIVATITRTVTPLREELAVLKRDLAAARDRILLLESAIDRDHARR
jgi:hypothetical protein